MPSPRRQSRAPGEPRSGACKTAAVLAAFVLAGWAWPGRAGPQPLEWWTLHAMRKVRPHDSAPATPSRAVRIEAARNEFEPFQIVLRARSSAVEDVDVRVSALSGPHGSALPAENITVYLEHFMDLAKPSSPDGAQGEWPDPLIPRVDRYAGEKRNAFPFRLEPERNQPLWIEVYVPRSASPGTYTGAVEIEARGAPALRIPVTLTVWSFTLPSTSSLRTAFGFSGIKALKAHRGEYTSDGELLAFTRLYARSALLHRISTYGGSMLPPPIASGGDEVRLDWSSYDREVGPFLDGKVLGPRDPLPGARVTSIDLRTHPAADSDEKKVRYWREWVRHFMARGWNDRLYHYVWDEPQESDYQRVLASAKLARRAHPDLRNLLTAPFSAQLSEAIDIWVPLINCFDSKPGFPDFCTTHLTRSQYREKLLPGSELWWYQSCASHGCNDSMDEYFRAWPSYAIDASAMSNRIIAWLSWTHDIQGNLYFATNEAFAGETDPWKNVYLHGGNGDGTLFYPGRPDRVGGATDIPIESVRLKLIREGLEDYEYLAALARSGRRAAAGEFGRRIAAKTYQWEKDPEVLYGIRRKIAAALSAAGEEGR